MCGIVGVFERRSLASPDRERVEMMRDLLTYRGPDAAGIFIDGPIGLGHRRLAIIDLSGGSQPMTTPDGRYTIVFNGEIYNYRTLRTELKQRYHFQTQSDTEVLLYQYIDKGPDGLRDLSGMFAVAIWDREAQTLFLARDRFGKKPLYLMEHEGTFLFASEPKSILAYLGTRPKLDREALTQYFLYEYIPSSRSPYCGMRKLPPGHWLRVGRSSIEEHSWWHLFPFPTDYSGTFDRVPETFDRLLEASVTARMVADVPVGVLLSGGIDSSTIAWYMRQRTKHLHSFSVSFEEPTFNESPFALSAAQALGTEHHDILFSLERFHEMLTRVRENMDEPLADASLLPTLLVSQEAKQYVTVVLDGDGADELLYGYGTFPAYHLSLMCDRAPKVFRRALERVTELLPTHYTDFSFDFKTKTFVSGLFFPGALRNQVWIGSFHREQLKTLLTSGWQEHLGTLYTPVTELERSLAPLASLERLSAIYLSHYLPEDILHKIDRGTMYASIEARTPFLDPTFVSFVLRLPERWKYRAFGGKRILKEVMAKRIPTSILKRQKKGFGIPLGRWLRGPLAPLLKSTLAPENIRAVGVAKSDVVERLVNEHLSGKADHRKKLWTLMIFHWWWEKYGGSRQ